MVVHRLFYSNYLGSTTDMARHQVTTNLITNTDRPFDIDIAPSGQITYRRESQSLVHRLKRNLPVGDCRNSHTDTVYGNARALLYSILQLLGQIDAEGKKARFHDRFGDRNTSLYDARKHTIACRDCSVCIGMHFK